MSYEFNPNAKIIATATRSKPSNNEEDGHEFYTVRYNFYVNDLLNTNSNNLKAKSLWEVLNLYSEFETVLSNSFLYCSAELSEVKQDILTIPRCKNLDFDENAQFKCGLDFKLDFYGLQDKLVSQELIHSLENILPRTVQVDLINFRKFCYAVAVAHSIKQVYFDIYSYSNQATRDAFPLGSIINFLLDPIDRNLSAENLRVQYCGAADLLQLEHNFYIQSQKYIGSVLVTSRRFIEDQFHLLSIFWSGKILHFIDL